jgi:hypothetical protein
MDQGSSCGLTRVTGRARTEFPTSETLRRPPKKVHADYSFRRFSGARTLPSGDVLTEFAAITYAAEPVCPVGNLAPPETARGPAPRVCGRRSSESGSGVAMRGIPRSGPKTLMVCDLWSRHGLRVATQGSTLETRPGRNRKVSPRFPARSPADAVGRHTAVGVPCAACAIDIPRSCTSFTASTLNSRLNLRRAAM